MISKGKNLLQKEVELDRERIVRLRRQGASLKEISEEMNGSVYYIREILIEELGDDYDTYNLGKERKIDTDRELIVRLRKERNSIEQISHEVNLRPYYIVRILKEELGDEYENYNLNKKWEFTRSQFDKVVKLRRSYMGLDQISKSCNIPCRYVKNILLEELGEEYSNYVFPNIYENVKKRLEEEQIREIVNLRNSGKNVKEISAEAGFSEDFIKFIVVGETNENLKYRWEKYRLGIRSEESVLHFLHEIYDDFVKEILALKHESLEDVHSIIVEVQEFQQLKPQCSSRFLTIWKKMSKYSKYRSPDRLCPPFIFSFFKANNIHVTSKFFLQQYRFSRHEWNESLRRIFRHFPAFRHRNRAQVVMGRITEVKDFFNLSSEFHRNSTVLLKKLWNYLNTTTDDVIAGTISALSLLSIKDDTITISKVCKRIGISHSSIIYQIKYKLFGALKIPGFNTLKSSKELIRSEIFGKIVGLENPG